MSNGGINGWIVAALSLAVGACGTDPGGAEGSSDPGLTGLSGLSDGSGDGEDTDDGDDASGGGGSKLDVGTEPPPEDEECAAVSEQAELVAAPADIIFVVDNSGSMTFEASEIQARMNAFSEQIIASGVDARVVLVSSYPAEGNGICIDPPLGGGGCPTADDNAPRFTHVDDQVGSHDAWERLLDNHDGWAGVIRPDSTKHIVVVTDDTSELEWSVFEDQLLALDPSYQGFLHHSVVCHSDCESAAGIGEDYIALSNATGGVAADLCDQDFQAVFDVLSTEVIGGSSLSCELEIPAPPDGQDFDPDEVNLEFHDGQGGVLTIGRVDSAAACDQVVDGWHYDDPAAPALIVMCPETCDKLQDALDGSISLEFGCASIPAG